MTDNVDEFLAHFGVKGMHWGVVHDKATSGNSSSGVSKEQYRQNKRNARAGKFEDLAKSYDTQIDALSRQTPKTFIGRNAQQKNIKSLQEYRNQALKDAEAKRQGKLSKGQKQLAIGAAVVGTILVGAAVYTGVQSGEFNRAAIKGKALMQGKTLDFAKNPKLAEFKDPDSVFENVVKGINPNYGATGTKMNCRRATFAYELRRRGYDVRATRTTNGYGQNSQGLVNAITPGKFKSTSTSSVIRRSLSTSSESKKLAAYASNYGAVKIPGVKSASHTIVSPKSIFDALGQQPDGSRGELGIKWFGGGGHSIAYEIFNGKPVVFDNQSGEKYDTFEKFAQGVGHVSAAGFTRLDNVNLNADYLSRWVKDAK